jgi:hypothetical protein
VNGRSDGAYVRPVLKNVIDRLIATSSIHWEPYPPSRDAMPSYWSNHSTSDRPHFAVISFSFVLNGLAANVGQLFPILRCSTNGLAADVGQLFPILRRSTKGCKFLAS